MSHYETLGVPKDADATTIKRAYRKKSGKAHPDRAAGSHQSMVALNQAYKTLSDPDKRARYDQTGEDSSTPKPPLDEKAKAIIMQFFDQMVERADDHKDLIALVQLSIRKNQEAMRINVTEMRAKVNKLEKRRKRLKYTGTDRNFLADLLDQRITAFRRQADQVEEDANIGDRALEMLKDFSYEVEKAPARGIFGEAFNSSGPVWTQFDVG